MGLRRNKGVIDPALSMRMFSIFASVGRKGNKTDAICSKSCKPKDIQALYEHSIVISNGGIQRSPPLLSHLCVHHHLGHRGDQRNPLFPQGRSTRVRRSRPSGSMCAPLSNSNQRSKSNSRFFDKFIPRWNLPTAWCKRLWRWCANERERNWRHG